MHAFFIIILIEIIIIVFCKIGHIQKCSCYIVIYYFLKIIFLFFFFYMKQIFVFLPILFFILLKMLIKSMHAKCYCLKV